jgi:hypothetical protein
MRNEFMRSSSPWALVADNAVILDPDSEDVCVRDLAICGARTFVTRSFFIPCPEVAPIHSFRHSMHRDMNVTTY